MQNKQDKQIEDEKILDKIFFSRYKTIKKIGEGSYGSVYKVISKGTDK